MIKRFIPLLIILSFVVGYPIESFAATNPSTANTTSTVIKTSTTVKKSTTVIKKKTAKKKKKRKEKLIMNPPLITLETAPHSPKKVAVSKKKAKIVVKKKA